jgi:hypothetical protein
LRCPPLPKLEGQVLSRETCILLFAKIINMLAGQEAERLFPCQSFMNASSDIKAATFMAGLVTGNPAGFSIWRGSTPRGSWLRTSIKWSPLLQR